MIAFLFILVLPWQVIAQNDGAVRLVGSDNSFEGRVEIYHAGQWGTVCDDYWDVVDATVVCKQLGYKRASHAKDRAHFGKGSSEMPIHLDNVKCRGSESKLSQCSHPGWGISNCGHSSDAGAVCTNDSPLQGDLRLSDGERLEEGRVEIYYAGQWGTVCNDKWGKNEARVACYQLGWPGVTWNYQDYGDGTGPIYMDNVYCFGYEAKLMFCSHSGWGQHDCSHEEDVGVRCSRPGSSPLFPWWVTMIIIMSILGVFFLIIAIIARCCQMRKRKRRNKKDPEPDPGSGEAMMEPTPQPVQTYVVADPGSSTVVTTTTYVAPGPSPFDPSQAYPPAQGGMAMQPMPPLPPTYDQSQEQVASSPKPTETANTEDTAGGQ